MTMEQNGYASDCGGSRSQMRRVRGVPDSDAPSCLARCVVSMSAVAVHPRGLVRPSASCNEREPQHLRIVVFDLHTYSTLQSIIYIVR